MPRVFVACVASLIALVPATATTGLAHAAPSETLVDDFESASSPSPWVFYDGAEFPGATGSLVSATGRAGKGARLAYDFTAGGNYVSATLMLKAPVSGVAVGYWVKAPPGIHAKLRVLDGSGQTLQYDVGRPLEATDPSAFYHQVVDLSLSTGHWGGANDGVVHQPLTGISLLAADAIEAGTSGAIDFDDITILSALSPSIDASGKLVATPSGPSDLASRLAVNIHFTSDDRALDVAKDLGFTAVRMDLGWGAIEQVAGVYDFSAHDALVASLAARGMHLHLILDYFDALYPGADSPSFGTVTVPAFAAMAQAAAAHFAGKDVTYEIWNEPNGAMFWPPAPSPTDYATLCAAAIGAVHAGDPAAKVSTAGISGFDVPFLRGYLTAGGGAGADAIGVHPYRRGGAESLMDDLVLMRQIVASSYATPPPIWDTEWGYSSTWYGDGHDGAARKRQAVMAVREILAAWAAGFPLAVYYDLRDDGTDPTNAEHNFGLIQNDYADKPAATAIRTLSRAAEGRMFAGMESLEPSSLHAARLDAGDGSRTWVVWSDAPGASISVAVSGVPTVTDAFGAAVPLTAGGAVTVQEADGPLYVAYSPSSLPEAGALRGYDGVTHGTAGCGCAFAQKSSGVRCLLAAIALLGMAARRRQRKSARLHLESFEELRSVLWPGHDADLGAAEPSITARSNEVVDCIEEARRQRLQELRERPEATQRSNDEEHGSRLEEHALGRKTEVEYYVHRVQTSSVVTVSMKDLVRDATLERGKAVSVTTISLQDELVQPIAEPAHSIVENDIRHRRLAQS